MNESARQIALRIDVSDALGLGRTVEIAATVVLPDPGRLPERPVVCFAKPGGTYTGGYYTCALPGPRGDDDGPGGGLSQADFHVARGWIFVALDNLGSGASTVLDPALLTFDTVTRASQAAEQEVLLRLANGLVAEHFPPVLRPVRIGLGQSTGGCLAIVQQARHQCYDGIAVLGFSAVHSHPATPPGEAPILTPWFARDLSPDQPGGIVNAPALARAAGTQGSPWKALAWGFHYDDVPADVVEQDLVHYGQIVSGGEMDSHAPANENGGERLPWISYTTPHEAARLVLTPGIVAPEAAAIDVPVLSAMGTRDLVVDPPGEARAFRSAPSFDLFICPRMGHMHNFAGTRALLWERIHAFGDWCVAARLHGIGHSSTTS